jgi:hypothetical protein
MSERIGMADGRCITSFDSNRIMNDVLMAKEGIAFQDNYKYRAWLQSKGPEALSLPLKNAACRSGSVKVLVEDE